MLIALFFLAASIFFGLALSKKLFSSDHLIYALPLGVIAGAWVLFFAALALGFNEYSLVATALILSVAAFLLKPKKVALVSKEVVPLFFICLLFFSLANYALFHYDAEGNVAGIPIDFGFHHSIISSIAVGNFPPEHPLFAGHPLGYYYFTHLYSAALLRGGFDLQLASWLPQILLATALVCILFILVRRFFPKHGSSLAYLAVALVLFNGTLAFMPYFEEGGSITKLEFHYSAYYAEGYAFQSILSAFIIFQRVFLLGATIILLVIFEIYKNKKLAAAILTGLLPMFHLFSFILIVLFLLTYAIVFDRKKKWIKSFAIIGVLSIPQLMFLAQNTGATGFINFRLGWMAPSQDLLSIIVFWFNNLGIYIILAVLGYYWLKDKKIKAIYLSTLPAFVLANLFIFTPYEWDNIKFFILFFMMTAILAAYALKKIWEKNLATKILVFVLFIIMTLTAFLSIVTVFRHSNDIIYLKKDVEMCEWVKQNTPPDALFLTSYEHTCLTALTGRRVFLGYTEWLEHHGLDYSKAEIDRRLMLEGNCSLLNQQKIDYVYLGGTAGKMGTKLNYEPIYAKNEFRILRRRECR